ncbi:MAG: YHYH protein [Polyangiales bacterium]
MRFMILLALASTACSSSNDSNAPATSDASTQSDSSTEVSTEASTSGARTLESCTTSIAADAPAFFATYFKCVTITTTADAIVIESQGLPPHLSYYYGAGSPNFAPFDTSRGSEYMPNPNKLKQKSLRVSVPKVPKSKGLTVTAAMVDGVVGTNGDEYSLGPVGIALDSVAIFNPLAAPGDDIEKEKFTFDDYSAHPAPDGTYHYHTASKGPLEVMTAIGKTGELYGVMCDGTIVLGCTELDGSDPGTLDAQGGHVGDVKDASTTHFTGRYHVHVCPTKTGGRRFTPEIQYYSTCGK